MISTNFRKYLFVIRKLLRMRYLATLFIVASITGYTDNRREGACMMRITNTRVAIRSLQSNKLHNKLKALIDLRSSACIASIV